MLFSRFESILTMFRTNPANAALYIIIYGAAILLSLMLHECGHGLVAYWCGDSTARDLGRLTLNPAKHLDPVGTFCMLLFGFGWARPVPVVTRNFRNIRRDYVLVSVAGIAVNLILFLLFMALSVILNQFIWIDGFGQEAKNALFWLSDYLVSKGDFTGYIDCFRIPALMYLQCFFQLMAVVNISLAVFNLLPVPPMDGWRILDGTLLRGRLRLTPQVMEWMRFGLIALMLSGLLGRGLSFVTGEAVEGVLWLYRTVGGLQ